MLQSTYVSYDTKFCILISANAGTNTKLSYRLENRASALCFRLIIIQLSGIWLFVEFSYTLQVVFLAKLHGNGRMRV